MLRTRASGYSLLARTFLGWRPIGLLPDRCYLIPNAFGCPAPKSGESCSTAIAGLFRSRAASQAEILVLCHQVNCCVADRENGWRSALGCRAPPPSAQSADALKILQLETVIRWRRAGFRAYWCWKSLRHGGPKTRCRGRGRWDRQWGWNGARPRLPSRATSTSL